MDVYLDIETIPDGSCPPPPPAVDPGRLEDLQPPSHYRDPDKIAAWREDAWVRHVRACMEAHVAAVTAAQQEWARGSLDPLRGRVLCVGICTGDRPVTVLTGEEADVLAQLETGLIRAAERDRVKIWTWNGNGFDRPFLAKRALRHGRLQLAFAMRVAKRWDAGDLMEVWAMGDTRSRATLDAVAAFLGIDRSDNPISGADVLTRYQAGDLDAIVAHCRDDVETLRQIHLRMQAAGWV